MNDEDIYLEDCTSNQEEFNKTLEGLNKQEFKSKLKFLNDHKGIRRGELHTILGPKGGSKSTVVKTLITEIIQNRKKLYVYLSEEAVQIYKMPIYRAFYQVLQSDERTNSFLSHLYMESQFNLKGKNRTLEAFFARLEHIIINYNLDALIFDNFTTSFLGRSNINEQAIAIELFKELAVKYNIPVIIVLHTAKGTDIYKQLLDGDNVRGNATSVNIGSYNYLITTFFRANPIRSFITVDKARYHKDANKQVYELQFDKELEIFTGDMKSRYQILQEIIQELSVKNLLKKKKANYGGF